MKLFTALRTLRAVFQGCGRSHRSEDDYLGGLIDSSLADMAPSGWIAFLARMAAERIPSKSFDPTVEAALKAIAAASSGPDECADGGALDDKSTPLLEELLVAFPAKKGFVLACKHLQRLGAPMAEHIAVLEAMTFLSYEFIRGDERARLMAWAQAHLPAAYVAAMPGSLAVGRGEFERDEAAKAHEEAHT